MARKIAVLALISLALVGLAFAYEAPAGAPQVQGFFDETVNNEAQAPEAGVDGFAVAGPVGGPVPDGAFSDSTPDAPAPAPGKSSASTLELSAWAGLAAASGFLLF